MRGVSTKKGFTLVEMLVAVAIFSLVMVMASTMLLSIVAANVKAQSLQATLGNLNDALDSMSRAIRTGTGYTLSSCQMPDGFPCTTLQFTSQNGSTVTYALDPTGKTIDRIINSGTPASIIGSNVYIDDLEFYEKNSGSHPYIIITVFGCSRGSTDSSHGCYNFSATPVSSTFNIQTVVSERSSG